MVEKDKLIKEAIDSIHQVTELFYQQKDKEGFAKLDGTLALLVGLLSELGKNKDQLPKINEALFNASLIGAMNALEKKDTVLLADILKYDIGTMLNEIISFN